MDTLSLFGWMFGIMGFWVALDASQKISRLEAELKRRQLIDENFGDHPEKEATSDPSTWSAEKKARVEFARKKVVAARWKIVLFFAVLVGAAIVLLFFKR